MKTGGGNYGKTRLVLNIYIAVFVTVLSFFVVKNLGTNNDQNRKIAQGAHALAKSNQQASVEGCHRGNYVREKINTISGALTELLEKSVKETEAKGIEITGEQRAFLDKLYGELAPLNPVNCQKKYGDERKTGKPPK